MLKKKWLIFRCNWLGGLRWADMNIFVDGISCAIGDKINYELPRRQRAGVRAAPSWHEPAKKDVFMSVETTKRRTYLTLPFIARELQQAPWEHPCHSTPHPLQILFAGDLHAN
jgi:hypothetical protein